MFSFLYFRGFPSYSDDGVGLMVEIERTLVELKDLFFKTFLWAAASDCSFSNINAVLDLLFATC
jgi:hypothetical protein